MFSWRYARFVLGSIVLATAAGTVQSANADMAITIVQQHTPVAVNEEVYFYAVPKLLGYFEEEGLDVTLDSVANAGVAAQVLQSGAAQFATTQPEAIMSIRENGGDAIGIFGLRRVNGSMIALRPDSSIQSLEDFRGKVVGGLSWGGGGAPILMRMLSDIGIGPDEYERVTVSAGSAAATALQNQQIDALVLWDLAFAAFENAGMEFRYIQMPMLREMGALTLATTESFATEYPAQVEGFCRAVTKGLHFTRTNIRAAVDLFFQEFPSLMNPDVDEEKLLTDSAHILSKGLDTGLWDVPYGARMGVIDDGTWETTRQFYIDAGTLTEAASADEARTDAFLDACNDFDFEEVAARASGYFDAK